MVVEKKFMVLWVLGLLAGLLYSMQAGAQTFVFAKLQGSPIDITGWNPQGSCRIGNTPIGSGNGEVILTDPVNSASGSIFYQTPINLSACRKWYAEFDFRIFDGTVADGLSFCYLDNPPVGAVIGGGLGIPPTANGLKICFDTWKNCGSDAIPKIEARWGVGYDECNGQPTRDNNDGAIGFVRSNSYNHCKITYDQGNISVFVNNTLYLTAFQVFNFPGYFGFTASTGGSNDRHSIKNAIIYTDMPASFAGVPVAICSKDSAQLGGVPDPDNTYLWSPAQGLSNSTSSNPKVSLDNGAVDSYIRKYYVETAFTSNPGCASRDSVSVKVYGHAKPDFTYSKACSFPATITFNDASQMGDGLPNLFHQFWGFGDPNASGSNPDTAVGGAGVTHQYQTAGPFGVWHAIKTLDGDCRSDTFIQVQPLFSKPVAAIQAPAEVCKGSDGLFKDISTGSGSTIISWKWDFGDGSFSSQQNPTHAYAAAGSFNIKLVIQNALGCWSDTVTVPILVNALPIVAFTLPAADCQNVDIVFADGSVSNSGTLSGWDWNFGDGVTDIMRNPVHRYFTYGNLDVTLKVATDKGCTNSLTKSLLIRPAPSVDFTVTANCSGSDAQFINLSQLAGGNQSDISFVWHFNDGNANPANPDSSMLVSPVHLFTAGGNYNLSLMAKSPFGCIANFVKPITIIGKPQVIVRFQNSPCSNTKQRFTDSSVVPFGILSKRAVYWDWEGNPTVVTIDNSPALGKTYQNNYLAIGGNANKKMVVKNIAFSANGCSAERYDTIVLLPSPQLVFDALPPVCISPVRFAITAARETSGIVGNGIFSGNGIDPGGLFDPIIAGAGTHAIRYIFVAANGCTDTATGNVEVNPLPVVNAGPDKTIITGGAALLDATFSPDVTTTLWSPGQTLNNPIASKPLASPLTDTWYTVFATTDKSCSDTDGVIVKVLPALKIPNVFSPNKDGINDVWNIPYLNSYIGCTMDIYDRYGRKIFSSTGYNQPWDATFNGQPLPVGVYYYILDIKNGPAPVTGSVTVVR